MMDILQNNNGMQKTVVEVLFSSLNEFLLKVLTHQFLDVFKKV